MNCAVNFDCDKLISLVEQRRGLYDPTCREYGDKNLKKQLWEEIYAEILPDFHNLSIEAQISYGRKIQTRWNSLRDCFRREMVQMRRQGGFDKKRRKYIYFDQLLFLSSHLNSNKPMPPISEELQESFIDDSNHSLTHVLEHSVQSTPCSLLPKKKTQEEEMLDNLNEGNKRMLQENDDDELFLFSLLPSLRKYKDEKKLLLRIEIMKTIIEFDRASKT